MSLINEALKKAQRQRVDAPVESAQASSTAGGPTPRIAKRRPPMPARTLVLLLVGGGLLLVMGGILTFVLLNGSAKPPVISKVPQVVAVAPVPQAPVPAVAVLAPATVKPVEVSVALATAPAPAPALPVTTVAPPRSVPIVSSPSVTTSRQVANPAVYPVLEALRISGVRVSGADSKVIMNDRIVRIDDYVDRSLGLRLTKVTATTLSFTDDTGFEYTKDL